LGIGTTSPTAILTLDSSSPNGTIMRVSNSSAGGHIFDWLSTGSANTGGAGRLDLYDFTAGEPRLSVAANGNVGVGTTSPFANFAVAGNAFLSGNLNVGDPATTRSNLGLAYSAVSDIINATNIATWGDSLTAGNEDGTGVTYPAVLARLTGRTVYNGGVGGQTSTQIRARETSAPSYLLSSPTIIWAGRNNYDNPSQVESDIAAMVAALGSNTNYLILSVENGSGENIGTSNYNFIISINASLASTYPGHYLDVREWLVQNGLSQAGIATSTQDQLDYNNDVPPTDLRYDGIHLNAAGYTVLANYIYSNFSILQASPKVITTSDLTSFSLPSLGLGSSTPRGLSEMYGGIATNTSLYLTNSGTNDSTQNISLIFSQDEGDSVNGGQDGAGGKIVSGRDNVYGGSIYTHDSNMQFYTAGAGVDTERMRITSGGMVGIGTTSPIATLDIAGTNTNNTIPLLQLSSVTATYSTTTRMMLLSNGRLGLGTTTPPYQFTVYGATSNGLYNASMFGVSPTQGGNRTILVTDNAINASVTQTGVAAPLVLQNNSGGNVGIGTTSPFAELDVAGADNATVPLFQLSSVASFATTTEFIVNNNGNATLAGTLSQTSDQRLKTNIQDLDASSSLAEIEALNPVTFNWIDPAKSSVPQFGFIAQQVQSIFPDLVSTTSPTALTPDGTLSLNYIDLISPIVAAIQQLDKEITSLASTVAGFAQSITTTLLSAQEADVQKLCVGGTCVTPAQFQAMVAAANQSASASVSPSPSTSAATDTPPVIQINGDSTAHIEVGASYTDLGATIIGPQADLNLGIKTFLNGALVSNIVVDTSAAATDTIDYVATDSQSLTSTSTRTVIIEATNDNQDSITPTNDNAQASTTASSIAQ
jgi:lysophospholipase L1-like esterase